MFATGFASTRGNKRIPLSEIDAAVAARLGPGRVPGNAQPAAFSRQVGMYLASQVGGWSTTQIGKYYNGRDHSTVCYAISRVRSLRETDPEVDGLLSLLTTELRDRSDARGPQEVPTNTPSRAATPLLHGAVLDAIADRVAWRLLDHIASSGLIAVPKVEMADVKERSSGEVND